MPAIAVVFVVLLVGSGVLAAGALAGKASFENAERQIAAGKFGEARASVRAGGRDFRFARLGLFPLKIFYPVPWVGKQLRAIDGLLSSGASVSRAIDAGLVAAGTLFEKAADFEPSDLAPGGASDFGSLSAEEKIRLLSELSKLAPQLKEVRGALADADATLAAIPRAGVAEPLITAILQFKSRLITLEETIVPLAYVGSIIPRLVGFPEPKTLLFLFQNNTEMRPSGGFMGSFGIIEIKNGELTGFKTDDTMAVDGPATGKFKLDPPPALRKYLNVDTWYFRDMNWSPDFRISAASTLFAFEREKTVAKLNLPTPSGIVAVTPEPVVEMLRLVGNITVSGTTFTPENLVDELEYQVELGFLDNGIPLAQRKGIQGELAAELVSRLAKLPLARLPEVLQIIGRALEQKHIILFDTDPALQAVYEEADWAGRVKDVDGDFLLVADANLAALKTDPVVERTISYQIRPEGGRLRARAEVRYKNTGSFTWKTTRYRTYTRVYAPKGSEFIRGTGAMENDKILDSRRRPGRFDVTEELDKAVFGAFISIEPKETRTLSVEYYLPPTVGLGDYELLVQKQAGTRGHDLTLDLEFGKTVKRASPAEEVEAFGDARYQYSTDLRIDRTFRVGL